MKASLAALAIAAIMAGSTGWAQDAGREVTTPDVTASSQDQEPNQGEDDTRPLTRVDIKYQYQNAAGSDNDDVQIFTVRADRPFVLSNDWQIATRVDVPLYVSGVVSSDNPDGETRFGTGDMLAQALLIHSTPISRFRWAAGLRLVLPTASEAQMGAGKWRIVSTVDVTYSAPGISNGSSLGLIVRYDTDFAGDPNRRHISELQLGPKLYIQFPRTWFLNLYPVSDIRYNLADELTPNDTGRWFVPLDLAAGRMLNKSTIASLEVGVPIVKQYMVYDFKIEARIGFFF